MLTEFVEEDLEGSRWVVLALATGTVPFHRPIVENVQSIPSYSGRLTSSRPLCGCLSTLVCESERASSGFVRVPNHVAPCVGSAVVLSSSFRRRRLRLQNGNAIMTL